MLIDTHCHLNFKAFTGQVKEVIARAKERGVGQFIVPGTDLATSKIAVELAQAHSEVWAAVGIHPHHIYGYHKGKVMPEELLQEDLLVIEKLLQEPRVVAVGEVGIDRYYYRDTKYSTYEVDDKFVELQEQALIEQIKLALKYDKALILHNRLAVTDILKVLGEGWDKKLTGRTVFHCCEAEMALLEFAKTHGMYIGVDGDISWSKKKQRFIKDIPLEMLVLETDSPYLTPLSLRDPDEKFTSNDPGSIPVIRDLVALAKDLESREVEQQTTINAKHLFNLEY